MLEIEKRYLVKRLPSELMNDFVEIEDYMILTGEPHPHLRLRRSGNKYELTKKYPSNKDNKLEMVEETISLVVAEFEALKKLPHTGQIKRRYKFKYCGFEAELDIWMGDLTGLSVVEFEFSNKEESDKFMMPEFGLCEITQDEWLAGGKLSGKKYQDIENELTKLGYIPIVESI